MKDQMDKQDEVNWSELIRKSINARLGGSGSRKIQKLVEEYSDDLEKMWVLHMFAHNIEKRYVYESAQQVFGEDKDDIVDEVEDDLEENGLLRMYDEVDGDTKVGDAILSSIAIYGRTDIEEQVRATISDSSKKIRDGVFLLSLFVRERIDREFMSINPEGFERTWKIYTGEEAEMDELVETGLIYRNYYSSNAYSHWYHKIPDYGMEMLEDVIEDTGQLRIHGPDITGYTMRKVLQDDDKAAFLRWMGGARKYIPTYEEEEEIQEELEENEIGLSWDDFQEVRDQLVRDGILIIDYRPNRSRAGRRSSRPAQWVYTLTEPAQRELPGILLDIGLEQKV